MDWLMLILLTCSEGSDCEPEMLQRPAEWIECEEQARVLEAGFRLVTEWQGEMRGLQRAHASPWRLPSSGNGRGGEG
jgi:hypothetical protein